MRNVQSPPPIVVPQPDTLAVKPAPRTGAVAAVGERNLPPLIFRHTYRATEIAGINRRWMPRAANAVADRRRFCRRILNRKPLQELRSGPDRRRHRRRAHDIATAVDEKI